MMTKRKQLEIEIRRWRGALKQHVPAAIVIVL
jgi:hypothetical protein